MARSVTVTETLLGANGIDNLLTARGGPVNYTSRKLTVRREQSPRGRPAQERVMLFIVARDQPALYQTLLREFGTERDIEVLYDRRFVERRRQRVTWPEERRQGERRSRPDVDAQLQSLGWVLVRSPRSAGPGERAP
jgi:hypothetical protein